MIGLRRIDIISGEKIVVIQSFLNLTLSITIGEQLGGDGIKTLPSQNLESITSRINYRIETNAHCAVLRLKCVKRNHRGDLLAYECIIDQKEGTTS